MDRIQSREINTINCGQHDLLQRAALAIQAFPIISYAQLFFSQNLSPDCEHSLVAGPVARWW